MHRLMYTALLSFAIASLSGCGGGDSTDESTSPTTGPSTGGAAKQAAAPTAAAKYETPQAAFEALSKAAKSNDWKAAITVLSPESQSMMAAGMMLGASFMTMGDEAKQKDLEQLLAKHGVNMDEEPSDEDAGAGPEALTRNVKDLPGFVGEINEWMQKNGDGSDSGFPEMGELGEVTIDGDTATASVDTEMGAQPIEFRRVDGSWLIHLPMEGPDADMPPDLEPIEDDGTPGLGTLKIGDEPFKLRQATAYKSKFFDDPCTVILLSARPLNERQLNELKEMLKEEGNDDAFFPFVPHVKLTLDESDELMSLFAWADNLSINSGSSDEVVLNIEKADNRISGSAQMPAPAEIGDTTYQFDATFDVELMAVADE